MLKFKKGKIFQPSPLIQMIKKTIDKRILKEKISNIYTNIINIYLF